MKKKLISYAVVALVLTACNSEEPITPTNQVNDAMGANPYRVSLTDALKNADALLGELGEDEVTRSVERKVESVEYYSRPGTRSLGGDTLLYLVNYADDAGFALLSADSRLRPIYAISDEGSMSFSDTTYNKGLALFARGVEAEIRGIVVPPPIPLDSIDTGLDPDFPIYVREIYSKVSPLLSVKQRNWHQYTPYNNYCKTTDNFPAYAGCAAIAVGQVMSYYSYPTIYGGEYFPWDEMNDGNNYDKLAKFIRILGNPSCLNISYMPVFNEYKLGSEALIDNIRRTFINMGYNDPGNLRNFSGQEIRNILYCSLTNQDDGGPVIVTGFNNNPRVLGHAWVIDGYVQYKVSGVVETPILEDTLFHCVWGWAYYNGYAIYDEGLCNGYFYWSDGFSGSPVEQESGDGLNIGLGNSYDYEVKYLGGFSIN